MKKAIVAALVFALCLPAFSLAETAADRGMRPAELEGYGIEMEIPEGWRTIDGKTTYNTESVDFAELNFPVSTHRIFTDGESQNLVHAFKVSTEALAGGDLIVSLEAAAGENGEWFDIGGLSFFVFVDVENSLCCAVARVESGIVILAAEPIGDPAFVEVFDEILSSVRPSDPEA